MRTVPPEDPWGRAAAGPGTGDHGQYIYYCHIKQCIDNARPAGGIVIIHQGAGRQGGLSSPGPGPVLVKRLKAGSAMQNGHQNSFLNTTGRPFRRPAAVPAPCAGTTGGPVRKAPGAWGGIPLATHGVGMRWALGRPQTGPTAEGPGAI